MARLIQDDSPLNKIPLNLQPDQRGWLQGVRFSVDILDISMQRLLAALFDLSRFSLTREADETQNAAAGVYSVAITDAWTAVDAARRLKRFLVDGGMPTGQAAATPVPAGRDVEVSVRELATALENVQALRNRFQHLDERLIKPTGDDAEAWGCINWLLYDEVNPKVMRSFVLVHDVSVGNGSKHYPLVNPLGKTMHAHIDHIALNAFGLSASLSTIYRLVAQVVTRLEDVLRPQFGGQPSSRIVFVASMEMSPDPPKSETTSA